MNYFDVALVFGVGGLATGIALGMRIFAFIVDFWIKDGQLIKTEKWNKEL